MSIFAQAARIVANLAGTSQQFIGPNGPEMRGGEYLAASSASFAGDGLTPFATFGGKKATGSLLESFMKLPRDTRIQFLSRAGGGNPIVGKSKLTAAMNAASIILWAITVVEVLELTMGFGPPDEGDDLKAGAQQFTTLAGQLSSALPDDSWQGSGSEAYADLDTALQNLSQTMAELDLQLAALVENQADWVTHMRLGFGILKDVLLAAFAIEIVMTFLPPPAGPVPARAFALTVSGLGITAATGFLTTLCTFSFENAKKADALGSRYSALSAGTMQTGSFAQVKVATARQSTVSSFEAISVSMSGTPAVASRATAASGSHAERAPLSDRMSATESPGGGAPEAPETTTPAATMPTLAQVSAMSGQASKLSGQLSQPAQLVNQAMGQLQQLVQMAQQSQGAAAPAERAATEGAALAGGVEGAGAALGTQGAERVPIDGSAAGAEAARESSRAGRTG